MNLQTSKLVTIAKIALGCFVLYTGYTWITKRIDHRQAQIAKRTSQQELHAKQCEQAHAASLRLEATLAQLTQSASMQDEAEQAAIADLTKLVSDSLSKIQNMQNAVQNNTNAVQNNTTQLDALHSELDQVEKSMQSAQAAADSIIKLIEAKLESADKMELRALSLLIEPTIQDAPHWTDNARVTESTRMIQQWAEDCHAHYTQALLLTNISDADKALIQQMDKIALSIINAITLYTANNAGRITNEAFFDYFNTLYTTLSKEYPKWSDYSETVRQTVQWRDPLAYANHIQYVYTRLQTIKRVQTLINEINAKISS